MSDDLMEVRRERPDLANDRDALIAEAERQMREIEEAIVRLNKAVDEMRSRDQKLRPKGGGEMRDWIGPALEHRRCAD